MSFLSPWALLWLGSLPVLFWLWRLASSKRQTQIPSLIPFEHLLRRPPTRHSRLVVNLLFWFQLVSLMLLALVFAQPVLFQQRAKTTLVIVDTSASMGARLRGTTAFERARQLLHARLGRKGRADQWVIMASAPVAALTAQPTSDPVQLRQVIDGLSVNDLGGDLGTTTHLGRALLGGRVDETLVVTDEPQPEHLAAHGVEFLAVGEPLPNTAIVGVEAQGPLCHETAARVLVTVQNFSRASVNVTLSAQHSGRQLTEASAALEPRARTTVPLTMPEGTEGWVDLRLEAPADALMADDRATVMVRRTSTLPVAVVSEDTEFQRTIGQWLGACEGLVWTSGIPAATTSPHLIVTDHPVAPAGQTVGTLQFLHHTSSTTVKLTHWITETDHPIASYLPAVNPVAASLDTGAQDSSLGVPIIWGLFEGQRLPIVLASEHDGRRVVSVFVDPISSAPSTPLLVVFFNSLRWLMGQVDTVTTGEPLIISSLTPGFVEVQRPDGVVERVAHQGGIFRYDATTRTGLYRVTSEGHEVTLTANFLDPRESDVMERVSTWRPSSLEEREDRKNTRVPQPLATSLALLVLVLLVLEWWRYVARSRWQSTVPHPWPT